MYINQIIIVLLITINLFCSSDTKDYALKQIEGTGLSMSACREIAVSNLYYLHIS